MELEVTWSRATKIWWSIVWRNLIAVFVSIIIGFFLGYIIVFISTMFGVEESIIQIITAPLSFVVGALISIIPIKMILNKDYGEFRLVLVTKDQKSDLGSDRASTS